jgi:hypothetical protein
MALEQLTEQEELIRERNQLHNRYEDHNKVALVGKIGMGIFGALSLFTGYHEIQHILNNYYGSAVSDYLPRFTEVFATAISFGGLFASISFYNSNRRMRKISKKEITSIEQHPAYSEIQNL